MWHSPEGKTTFTGPFAYVLAYSIGSMTELLEAYLGDEDDDYELGHLAFDRLTDEQKIWSLHRVAFGLLDRKTEIVPLTAYLEATIASIFRQIESDIDLEIQATEMEPDEDHSSLRTAILAAYELDGGNSPEVLMDDEEPLTVDCDDTDEWIMAMEILEGKVLWDDDYDLDMFDDMPPAQSESVKDEAGISDDYYAAIPDAPKRAEAIKLLKETRKLCNRVMKREEKNLKK